MEKMEHLGIDIWSRNLSAEDLLVLRVTDFLSCLTRIPTEHILLHPAGSGACQPKAVHESCHFTHSTVAPNNVGAVNRPCDFLFRLGLVLRMLILFPLVVYFRRAVADLHR